MAQANNHPQKGDIIAVDPIRDLNAIAAIKTMLADKPRDYALFVTGLNTNLRASDLRKITIGQVRGLKPGDPLLTLREQKTSKHRRITINQTVYDAISRLLLTMPDAQDSDYLFQSRKGHECLTVSHLNRLVKGWCAAVGLKGNYGSHSLRKSWAFWQYSKFKVQLPTLMQMMNHSNPRQTLHYLGIQPADMQEVYLNEI